MKFEQAARRIETSTPIQEIDVKITANAKMFTLLFKTIYPNIKKAIVRETVTNAWDSHTQKGNTDVPFDIHAPSRFEPWYSIRDYGVSMTHEQVVNVFSNIGESSKDGSNELAGMFGMGSKSPLGYTDTFSIQCWLNGTTRIYDIFTNERGAPKTALKYEGESDEPDGVLMSMGIEEKDIPGFQEEITNMLFGFPTPVKKNGELVVDNTMESTFKGTGWALVPNIYKTYIRMGCVMYPLRAEFINLRDIPGNVLGTPMVLDFPIGTFGVTGSREDILYTDETTQRVTDAFNIILDEFPKFFVSKIAEAKTYLEARALYDSFVSQYRGLVAKMTESTTYWHGKSLYHWASQKLIIQDNPLLKINSFDFSEYKLKYNDGYLPKLIESNPYLFNPIRREAQDMIFVYSSKTKNLRHRLKRAIMDCERGNVSRKKRMLIKTDDQNSLLMKRIWAFSGKPRLIDLDKVDPMFAERSRRYVAAKDVLYLNHFSVAEDMWERKSQLEVNQNLEVVYALTEGNHLQDITPRKLNVYLQKINYTEFLWQIPKFQLKGYLHRFPNVKFRNIVTEANDFYASLTLSEDQLKSFAANRVLNGSMEAVFADVKSEFMDVIPTEPTLLDKFAILQHQLDEKIDELEEIYEKKFNEFLEKYPLLSCLDYSKVTSTDIQKYIEIVKTTENS